MRTLLATHTNTTLGTEPRKFVLDSFAWIEYFSGSPRGEKVRQFVERGNATTPTIVLAEVTDKYMRMRLDPEPRMVFIMARSRTAVLDEKLARLAGRINYDRKRTVNGWGMVDSIILATARSASAKVVTGDHHFKDLVSETIMI